MKKRAAWISILTAAVLAASGCGSTASGASGKMTETALVTAASSETAETAGETENTANAETSSETTAETDSDMFTDRDLSGEYDESSSVFITLNGDSASCNDGSVTVDGSTVTIAEEGTYVISGTLEDGMIIVDADENAKVQLVLKDADINSETSAAIYVKQADKVFLTLADGTENTLSNGGTFTAIDENSIDAVVFAKDDLTINGGGSLTVTSPAGHGIVSKDDLKVTGGDISITAASKGLSANDSVRIADGTFVITAGTDGIHTENEEDAEKGYVYISGGTFTIQASDDGIHSSGDLTVNGGTFTVDAADDALHSGADLIVNGGTLEITAGDDGLHADNLTAVNDGLVTVTDSYEGIEGLCIEINGGQVNVTASDDGMNAAGGNDGSGDFMFGGMGDVSEDSYLLISGGTVIVDSSGDGLDSNGSLEISGGVVYVSGPTDNGNGALDYGMSAEISGGTIIAAGASGMAENFTSGTQGSMLVTVDTQNGGDISLTDSNGNVLVSWTAQKAFNSVLISTPEISGGETYTLTAGDYTETITMDSLIYGSGMGMGGMNGGMPGGMNGGMGGGPRR